MKIAFSQKARKTASTLLVVMVLGGILCLLVVYYLSLTEQQTKLSARSQAWNMAIAVSEAGIEEALQQLNSNGTPLASDGWVANGTVYSRTNTLPPNGDWYTVSINLGASTNPVITAHAYINLPALAAGPASVFFAAAGVNVASATVISRGVQVTCSKNPASLFTASMVSRHTIDLKGNGVLTDSFDSSNPVKSTNGKYDPSKYKGDFGDAATDDSIVVGVGNANIYGKLHSGPGSRPMAAACNLAISSRMPTSPSRTPLCPAPPATSPRSQVTLS
jgi:hypothetical protein